MTTIDCWNLEDEQINHYFNRIFPNYKFNTDKNLEKYIKKLAVNSYINSKYEKDSFAIHMRRYMDDIQLLFSSMLYLKYLDQSNYKNVLNKLEQNLRRIDFLPNCLRGIYGRSVDDCIELNPYYNARYHDIEHQILGDEGIERIYLYHEIGHKILGVSDSIIQNNLSLTANEILRRKGMPYVTINPFNVQQGFVMLEEIMTQDFAEDIAFFIAHKKRPPMRNKNTKLGIRNTNLDFYGESQNAVIDFGETLRGCGEVIRNFITGRINKKRDTLIRDMNRKALHGNFANDIIAEYNEPGADFSSLIQVLDNLGNIARQSYASFGQPMIEEDRYISPGQRIRIVDTSLNRINKLTRPMVDYNYAKVGGYDKFDFSQFVKKTNNNINTFRK